MKTIRLTERERDALYSLLKPYAEGIANLKNSKGDTDCFRTFEGRLFSGEEACKLLEELE